jgi:hypothetical protein
MSRTRLFIALLATTVAVVVAVLLASGALDKSNSRVSASPACLPSTLEHGAKLAGLPVNVSPAPGTLTANPRTQISFLGAPVGRIHDLSVVGQRSGRHSGELHGYSQRDGASFTPETPFDAGERVVVHATLGTGANTKPTSFAFHVDTPYSTAAVAAFPNPSAAPSDYHSFATLPGLQAPILTPTVADRDPSAGDVFMTNGPGPGSYGALIYTPRGRLVWFHRLSGGSTAENLSVQSYKGSRDLTFWQGKVLSLGYGEGEDVVMDDHYRAIAKVPGGNGLKADLHDFQIVPHDIAYITAYNPIHCDLSSVEGASDGAIIDTAVQEIDLATGLVRWEWHTLDHIGVQESETAAPSKPDPWDWFHLNSIDPQPDGNLFISGRSTWAGYQLQAGTGEILWRLGGLKSSFEMGPGTKTAWQHDGRILPNGEVTFFDNGSNPPVHDQSRAVRIALDYKTHRARLSFAYTHPNPPLLAASQGDVQTLASGNSVVGYGGAPELSEYDDAGALLFDAHLPYDMSSYRALRFPWSGQPSSPPTVLASLNNTGEETIVHASWNGATDVVSWRVLAGKSPNSLKASATIPAIDFESSTILPKKYAYAAAQALSSTGRLLGSSTPVRVGRYASSLPTSSQSR